MSPSSTTSNGRARKVHHLQKLAARMTSIAIYLVPVYIIILCVLVNYIVVSASNILAPGSTSRFYGSSNLVLRDDRISIPRRQAKLLSVYRTPLLRTYRSVHPPPSVVDYPPRTRSGTAFRTLSFLSAYHPHLPRPLRQDQRRPNGVVIQSPSSSLLSARDHPLPNLNNKDTDWEAGPELPLHRIRMRRTITVVRSTGYRSRGTR